MCCQYGTLDVIHAMHSVGQLDRLNSTARRRWKDTIDAYQSPETGFYSVSEDAPGRQPYHAAGEATAALALLGLMPKYNNSNFSSLATADAQAWHQLYDPLYDSACYSKKLGGNNIHSCGQQIGAIPAVLAYTSGHEHSDFIHWWVEWVDNHTDPVLGVLCPIQNSTYAHYECIGGGMPTHGIKLGLGYNMEISNPQAVLGFALSMQNAAGTWSDKPALPAQLGSLTLDGIFQVTRCV